MANEFNDLKVTATVTMWLKEIAQDQGETIDQSFRNWVKYASDLDMTIDKIHSIEVENPCTCSDCDELIERAISNMALTVQSALGVESGDNASVFFSDEVERSIKEIIRQYIAFEIANQ